MTHWLGCEETGFNDAGYCGVCGATDPDGLVRALRLRRDKLAAAAAEARRRDVAEIEAQRLERQRSSNRAYYARNRRLRGAVERTS